MRGGGFAKSKIMYCAVEKKEWESLLYMTGAKISKFFQDVRTFVEKMKKVVNFSQMLQILCVCD